MALAEINLLPQEAKVNLHYLKLLQSWRRRFVALLAIFLLNAGFLLAGQWWLSSQVDMLKQKQASIYSQIMRFSPHFQQQLIARQNIRDAAALLQKRRLFSRYLEALRIFLGKGVVLKTVSFRGNNLTIQGYWQDLNKFNSFEERAAEFRRWLPASEFSDVSLQSVVLKPEGAVFTLVLKARKS